MIVNTDELKKVCNTDNLYYSPLNNKFVATLTAETVKDTEKHIRIIKDLKELGATSTEELFDQTTGLVNLHFRL